MATLDVKLWGEKIRVSSDHDEDFIRQVADYLNKKMNDVHSSDETLITTKIAALRAAYCIAAEYFLLRQKVDKLEFAAEEIDDLLLRLSS